MEIMKKLITIIILVLILNACKTYKINSSIDTFEKNATIGILQPKIIIHNVKNIIECDVLKLKNDFQNKLYKKLIKTTLLKELRFQKLMEDENTLNHLDRKNQYVLSSEYEFLEFGNDFEGLASIILTGIPLDRGVQNLKMKLIDTFSNTIVWELEVKNGVLFSNFSTAYEGLIGYPVRELKQISVLE